MTAQLLAGAPVAEEVLAEVAAGAAALADRGITPGLGTILVGADEASAGYVRKKHETCAAGGHGRRTTSTCPADGDAGRPPRRGATRFNDDPAVDGYLIQYPLPPQFDFNAAVLAMDPDKDADGLHPVNLGRLVLQEQGPRPCTPAGHPGDARPLRHRDRRASMPWSSAAAPRSVARCR